MAKKTNKTEHVLKLISKEEDSNGAELEAADREPVESAAGKEEATCRNAGADRENTLLVNIAEQLVMENIQEVMERMNVCSCPVCTNDIAALALNMLPQKYITTNKGKQFTQIDIYKKQYETDVLAALTKACVRVKAGPRHG